MMKRMKDWMRRGAAGLLAALLITLCVPSADAGTKDTPQTSHNVPLAGICLDCSNRYYSVREIERYIRLASGSGNGYVQLHLTGDSNVGIECRALGQTPDRRYRHGKAEYYNRKTKRSFLTDEQIRRILAYADKQHVQIVPEIDMPGHMKGFAKLYRQKYGKKAASRIFGPDQDALQIRSAAALRFSRKIYREYAGLFSGCLYFHIGCDEFWDGDADSNISYINRTAALLQRKGFQVWIWNDLLTADHIGKLNPDITVTYWSWDGDAMSAAVRKERRRSRASLPALQKAGFRVLNYNSYYLYYVPSPADSAADDRYMIRDLKENWDLQKWDGENGAPAPSGEGIAGAAVSVWNEDAGTISYSRVRHNTGQLYRGMTAKMQATYYASPSALRKSN